MQSDLEEARRLADEASRMIEEREPVINAAMAKGQHGGRIETWRAIRQLRSKRNARGTRFWRLSVRAACAQRSQASSRKQSTTKGATTRPIDSPESAGPAASDDLTSQTLWRGVRAKALARRGEGSQAEQLAREGQELIEKTEFALYHALALLDLAEVLRLAGKADEAVKAAEGALALFERKGNIVMAEHTRTLVAELAAV